MEDTSLSSSSEEFSNHPPLRPKTTRVQRRTALGAVNRNVNKFAPKIKTDRKLSYYELSQASSIAQNDSSYDSNEIENIDGGSPETIQREMSSLPTFINQHYDDDDDDGDGDNAEDDLVLIVDQQQTRITDLLLVLKNASENIRKEREAKEIAQQKNDRLLKESKKSKIVVESFTKLQEENKELLQQLRLAQANPNAEVEEQRQMLQTELYLQESINKEQDCEIKDLREKIESMRSEVRMLETKCGIKDEQLSDFKRKQDRQPARSSSSETEAALLLNRMSRACAPPPDQEMIGQLIDVMVVELSRAWYEQHKVNLNLTKIGRSRYRYGDRLLHLQVQNNKLVYRTGAGHKVCDLFGLFILNLLTSCLLQM